MKTNAKSWELPLFITMTITIFYGIFFALLGHIPETEKIVLINGDKDVVISLPFVINKFWDIIFIYISVSFLIKTVRSLKEKLLLYKYENNFLIGILTGAAIGLMYNYGEPLMVIISFSFFLGVFFGYSNDRLSNSIFSTSLSLGICFGGGLIACLTSFIFFNLASIITSKVKQIFSKKKEVVCFLLREKAGVQQVLLGFKTQKTGKDKWNGYGGGIEKGERPTQAIVRELEEELGVYTLPCFFNEVAVLEITDGKHFWKKKTQLYVFTVSLWHGKFTESNEMITPTWYEINSLPKEMMKFDYLWLPRVLNGDKLKGTINKAKNCFIEK